MNHTQFDQAFDKLPHRRKQVLLKVLAGETDAKIAQALTITEATVRKHIENICKEFGIRNDFPDERRFKRPELIALFDRYKPELVNSQALQRTDCAGSSTPLNENFLEADELRFSTIYNRDVFILIDQSGSMVRKDADTGTQTRYEYLQEVIEGHIASILSAGWQSVKQAGQQICESVSIYFFSRYEVAPNPIAIADASQVWKIFSENQPKTTTFIAPTLEKCLDTWLNNGKLKNRGAFFIIYTDGLFNDEPHFINCIAKACANIDNPNTVKFFVLGVGKDIDIKHFLDLDFNVNNQMPYDIFVFDLVNEVDDIISLLKRQITNDPLLIFPKWVKEQYPEFVQQVLAVRQRI
ncbi:LuxR C-terminal-related transcriptional regulator [Microcoleus sp. FACHB-68]|uniref:LuxR C-terminal-related transcriptional regulator n=1 Tax=Microcoleus sp. FACHB-68 TaxID=2692826 RepID=UPI001688DD5E|nr:LuxR C-terminal-related transcriptional regulator [Microcoleus sp. FACHB-68]MBD1939114.1 RNA polymerase subunit sigma-70 [Microcoleus sp. FACHB-68]